MMSFLLSAFLLWLFIKNNKQQERLQTIEKELSRLRSALEQKPQKDGHAHGAATEPMERPAVDVVDGVAPGLERLGTPDNHGGGTSGRASGTTHPLDLPSGTAISSTPFPLSPENEVRRAAGGVEPESVKPERPVGERAVGAQPPIEKAVRPAARSTNEAPRPTSLIDRAVKAVANWFTSGNVPVKVGVVVTFFGIAALIRYAYAQGYFHFPIEARMLLISAGAVAALAFGWRERERKPGFALSLQGGAIGTLMLVVFSSFRLFNLLPAGPSLIAVVWLVVLAAGLAVRQNSVWLALLGFLGGYLAPVLISTGSGNVAALFGYYAILNAAVFGIAWVKSWRDLNLMGFAFTFGVGGWWGNSFYTPAMLGTVEPFLILFFLFYAGIGLLHALKQTEYSRPWVDGTLVFGTPLMTYLFQSRLLEDNQPGLALSALVMALFYAVAAWLVRTRTHEKLLGQSYLALAFIFSTLAPALAFSASTTSMLWALEGVGLVWLGVQQKRDTTVLAGLALQVLAAGAHGVFGAQFLAGSYGPVEISLLTNPIYFGSAVIALAGFLTSILLWRSHEHPAKADLTLAWGAFWWIGAGLMEMNRAAAIGLDWEFLAAYITVTLLAAGFVRGTWKWGGLEVLIGSLFLAIPVLVLAGGATPLSTGHLPFWGPLIGAALYALYKAADDTQNTMVVRGAHAALLWSGAALITLQWHHTLETSGLGAGWRDALIGVPLALWAVALWRWPERSSWPMQEQFAEYHPYVIKPMVALLVVLGVRNLFHDGALGGHLPYIPLLNPLEISLLAGAWMLSVYLRGEQKSFAYWPHVGFLFITMATLRGAHHMSGAATWWSSILSVGAAQTSLTIVWSLLGMAMLIHGSKRGNRELWKTGGTLMLIVLSKLILIDRAHMGNMPGIVSFIAVGFILMAVGYFAPQPPKSDSDG